MWDAERGVCLGKNQIARNLVTSLRVLPAAGDGGSTGSSVLVQGGEDLRLRIWDVRAAGGAVATIRQAHAAEGYVYFPVSMDVSSDGRFVLTGSQGFNSVGAEARLWDLRYAGRGPVATS